MGRPVWLLDVDGVINVDRPGWDGQPSRGNASVGGQEFELKWAPGLIARIRALHEGGQVTIRWCSTWCVEAEQLERLFGLPRLERAWSEVRIGGAAAAAKLAAARDVLARGHRLVWTDDVEVPIGGPVYDELTDDGRALLIRPSPWLGLRSAHLDEIDHFVRTAGAENDAALEAARRFLDGTEGNKASQSDVD